MHMSDFVLYILDGFNHLGMSTEENNETSETD